MKLKLFLSAVFDMRNIAVLMLTLGTAYLLELQGLWFLQGMGFIAGVLIYVAMVLQSLTSRKFNERFNLRQKAAHIRDLDRTSVRMANEVKRDADAANLQKLRKVMEDRKDIMESFTRGERSFLKERIVEQTLNLVIAYIRLFSNFCIRSRQISNTDISEIAGRINMNTRKVSFIKDVNAADDLKKAIEMDEKVINGLKEERKELERLSVKLDYMGSMVSMFKHQILSRVETEDMLEKLEAAVNEASALDNVLEERNSKRMRI